MTPPPSPPAMAAAGAGGRHVLMFPLPYQGHINPMIRLAGVLHARGFAITVFHTHFNAPNPTRHPDYRFVPIHDGTMSSGDPPPVAVDDVVRHIHALNESCEAAFRDRLAAVLDEYSKDGDVTCCLVADAHLIRMVEVATWLAVPTLVLRTGSAACFAGFLAYPLLCHKGYLPVRESSELDMPVAELPPYRVRDLTHVGKDGHEMVCELIARAVAAVKLSSGLILDTFDAIEAPEMATLRRDLAVPVFDVGPLHKFSGGGGGGGGSLLRQDRSCLDWLETQSPESVLYASFGSLANMTGAELVETAWGIAGSGVPFLWVVRPGLVRGEPARLPEGFEAATRGRGVVVEWAPQEEVLRHRAVGGFWTHGGWNSTAESICEGVPMICRPNFGDQMGNARYVEHVWRVGFEVGAGAGELERGTVEAAIRRLMTGSDGGEMRARARELKKAAAECAGEAGSSELAIVKMVAHMMSL